ncbi:MAG: hypothetical protein LBI87_00845 [Candidatus Accumulibacter sp.]|jgi:hypothetical protein|nr:hypothetical protein [Accumulibacter sp.]
MAAPWALLRRQVELLVGERQSLLRVVGAGAALIAGLDSGQLPAETVEAARRLAASIDRLPEESLRDALDCVRAETRKKDAVPGS